MIFLILLAVSLQFQCSLSPSNAEAVVLCRIFKVKLFGEKFGEVSYHPFPIVCSDSEILN